MDLEKRRNRFGWIAFLGAVLSGAAGRAQAPLDIDVVFTAGTRANVFPCERCRSHAGAGGLSRRATVLEGLRTGPDRPLVLDAGDFLFDAEGSETRAAAVAALYRTCGYDAVNVTHWELRRGAARLREILAGAGLTAISANILDPATGAPIFPPYSIHERGGRRVAVLGTTEPPAGLEYLPALQEGLASVAFEPARTALEKWLPRARAEADAVVLLHHGPGTELQRIREEIGKDLAAILAGGILPGRVPDSGSPPVFTAERHGAALTAVTGAAARDTEPEARSIAVDAGVKGSPEADSLIAARGLEPPPPLRATAAADRGAVAGGSGEPLRELPVGPPRPLGLSARNRGVRLALASVSLAAAPAGATPESPGRGRLVLDTGWENLVPLTVVNQRQVPTAYRIPNVADHLYVVVNGRELGRVVEPAGDVPDRLPLRGFELAEPGSRLRGSVLFDVPGTGLESVELRFYDYAHGHMTIPILVPAAAPPGASPVTPLQRNEVVEAGVFGLERRGEHSGRQAPEGMLFVEVEVRARSLVTIDGDATAFDPKAAAGSRIQIGTVADWKESRRYLQLVVDGEYGFAPIEASPLAPEPRFLPDVLTGGRVVFLAPAKASSLDLRCDFPNALSSAGGATLRPRGLTFLVEGARPVIAERPAIASVDDDVFAVAITGSAFAPAPGPGGASEKLFILEATVRNTGRKGELFQPLEQLQYIAASGRRVAADPAGAIPWRAPPALLWIPGGERRSFGLSYRVPASEARPRLAYAGVSTARILELEPGGQVNLPPLSAPVAGAPGAPAPPADVARAPAPPPPAPPAGAPPAPPPAGAPAEAPPVPPPTAPPPAGQPAGETMPPETRGAPSPLPAAAGDLRPRGLAGVGLTAEEVNRAIDRGADFLWSHLKTRDFGERRRKLGDEREHILAALALVHAGAHERHADFDRAVRGYLETLEPRRLGDVYQIGIACMLVEAYGDPSFLPKITEASRYFLEAQGKGGTWTYKVHLDEKLFESAAEEGVLLVSGGVPLDGGEVVKTPIARRSDWEAGKNADGDNSVTQYAILGIHAASRSGLSIAGEVWRRASSAFEERQCEDGGWHYQQEHSTGYGSMTCAGICSLAIVRHQMGGKDIAADPAIRRGLDWLAKNFSVSEHPGHHDYLYYYLYALERVGRVLDIELVGPYEWYPLGARHLLSAQGPDGGWVGTQSEADPRLATSFALLFLTRATPSLKAPELPRGGEGTLRTGLRAPGGNRYFIILDASGSMTAEMNGRTKWEIAREAVENLIDDLPEGSEVGLRVYGHRKTALDAGASEDTALEVPLGPLSREGFRARLQGLRPRGKTPLARSLLDARGDLHGASAERPVDVVLLTDGGEDTLPRQDPLAAARSLGELQGIRFHVVGFDIGREDWTRQLREMSGLGRGRYWPAREAGALRRSLRAAVLGVPEGFTVIDGAGKPVAAGAFGDSRKLPEGKYRLQASYAGNLHEESFWINTGTVTSITFNAVRAMAQGPAVEPAPPGPARPPAPPVPAARKFCTGCGKPLAPDARFCTHCGQKA